MKSPSAALLDAGAVALSSLCLLHCLALPLLAAALPLFGVWAEAEWVHLVFVAIALPLGLLVGALAGYFGRWIDSVLMRFVDLILTVPLLVVLIVVASVIALLLPVSGFQRLAMIGVLIVVLIVELINSAIEAVVDRISLERHPLSKAAKDIGSAAVALALLLAFATWAVVLYNRFM